VASTPSATPPSPDADGGWPPSSPPVPVPTLSHASAAACCGLRASNATIVDIGVAGRAGRAGRIKRPGLRIHRPRTLRTHEVTTHDRITVTTPARTILALAATLQPHRLERLLDQAEILELTDYPALDAMAGAHPAIRARAGSDVRWRDTRPA
jgi:hypothetical protein